MLKILPYHPSLVIGITGNALPEDMDFFVSSGADLVVTKPLSRAKLLDVLHGLVATAMDG